MALAIALHIRFELILQRDNLHFCLYPHLKGPCPVPAAEKFAAVRRLTVFSGTFSTDIKVGTSVVVPIPDVDRGRAEFPNVKGIVMHKIGTEHGVLNTLHAANCITPCREAFMSMENVPENTVSRRTAANSSAMGTGQVPFKCGCKQKCKCFKSKVKCNSKYHRFKQDMSDVLFKLEQ